MANMKQYLENSWYRWASQDRQNWYAAQFQYWEWINVRDMKNWVCLAWWATDESFTFNSAFKYFSIGSGLFIFTSWWDVVNAENWTVMCSVSASGNWLYDAIQFWNYVYLFLWDKIFRLNYSAWTTQDITPAWYAWVINLTCPAYNYANTYLLFWNMWIVWRMDVATWTEIFTKIRSFNSWYLVYWLTQEWNYLKIYTTNRKDTKIHYAKGTFDVEDTWLVQTVSLVWLAIPLWYCITSDWWNDYALLMQWNNFATDDYKLFKIQWYSRTEIRDTQKRWGEKIFAWNQRIPCILASDWVLFASMDEWIWTFTEYNGWLWWWCVEFPKLPNEQILSLYKYEERLYACVYDWTKFMVRHYDMSFHPDTRQKSWFIIGRVFDWWCAWLFKKNIQATVTYNMPEDTSMELSYRYDRSSFSYDKANFHSIKVLTDTTNCYDIVVPTTPWKKEEDLLLLENWDQILLENWNWILLEDLMVCPFNRPRNLLEYRVDFSGDWTKTPILFEHNLIYEDSMRKYRKSYSD